MVDLNSIWVAAWIDQALIAQLKEKQSSTIRLRSGRKFDGKIARINKEADTVTRELEVDVQFEQLPEPLVIGEEAEVFIISEVVQRLAVPLTAVLSRDGKTGVFVVEQGRAVFREISLGPHDKTMAAVSTGLKEGDIVVISPGNITDHQKIKPVEQKI
jgi:HlyD family secretion protein